MKVIYRKYGVVRKLAKIFDVSEAFVSMSLDFERNSKLAIKIRNVAVKEYDCIEIETNTKN